MRHLGQLEEPLAIMQALFSENGSNAQFLMPDGRTDAYTIIEVTIIEGRTTDTKKIQFACYSTKFRSRWGSDLWS